MKLQLLFNPKTRKFIGFGCSGQDLLNNSQLLIKEIEVEKGEFNLSRYKYIGDYDTGELVDTTLQLPIVSEYDVIEKNLNILQKKFKIDIFYLNYFYDLQKNNKDFLNDFSNICEKIEKEKDYFDKSSKHVYYSKDQIQEEETLCWT